LRGSGQLGPNGLSGAGHKRRRHGTNDIGKATNGSSGEAGKTKMAKLETASAGNATAQRTTAVEMAIQAAAVVTAAMAVRPVQDGTRGLAEVPLPLNYRAKYIAYRLALSRLCHEVLARICAARCGNPGEFFALRKPHFSFIVDLYSFLRARQPERSRMSSRSMSCYATSICRTEGAIAFMRDLTGHLIVNCASLLHTKIKDNKHRNLLDLSTGEWELLDEDGKADRLDLYYVEKEAKEEAKKEATEAKKEVKKEAKEAKKEAKKEAEKKRKRVGDAKEVERAEKTKAALEITKSQGKSTGVIWNKSNCKWVVAFQRRGTRTRKHLGYFDDHAEAAAAYSSYRHSFLKKKEGPVEGPRLHQAASFLLQPVDNSQ
jgi:hypothetical protein